jgi:hypothetical protein
MARTFYRIAKSDPPTPDDFKSDEALGIPPRDADPETLRLHSGVSAFATETQARNKARAYPWLGRFIVRLEIPKGAPIAIERTLVSRGHHTLWGDPTDLLRCVIGHPILVEPW